MAEELSHVPEFSDTEIDDWVGRNYTVKYVILGFKMLILLDPYSCYHFKSLLCTVVSPFILLDALRYSTFSSVCFGSVFVIMNDCSPFVPFGLSLNRRVF